MADLLVMLYFVSVGGIENDIVSVNYDIFSIQRMSENLPD
jgi:hypothetical protein